ncbi:MAG: tRNA (guanosine(37)-N1)-methyltransferase TrmD [Clostridiales bacterium]|nr:tRNA (guanosine(37)-N1)-methyltransferase TrmD [Clostridiales bacterium]
MKIDILTLFPEMFVPLKTSILKRAQDKNLIEINIINFRDFSKLNRQQVDDVPFGGGDGMVLMCEPIFDCINSIKTEKSHIIYMSPKGKTLKQTMVTNYLQYEHLIILCGHYEGVDQRIIDYFNMEEISIGDYVLTGGELPSMVFVDCLSRLIPNVLHNNHSSLDESFSSFLLEYPQYTRPAVFNGMEVPKVLLSGNHKEIEKYRQEQSLEITRKNRPDLLGED